MSYTPSHSQAFEKDLKKLKKRHDLLERCFDKMEEIYKDPSHHLTNSNITMMFMNKIFRKKI